MEQAELSFSVLGAGAWGAALATVAARAGLNITLWGRRRPEGILNTIVWETDLAKAAHNDVLLLAVPCQALRSFLKQLKPHLSQETFLINTAKGIELERLMFPSEIIEEEVPDNQQGVLSGPSFAHEVMAGHPTLVTLATHDRDRGRSLAHHLWTPTFRPYISKDIRGVELGGAVKNVFAIACGAAVGYAPGENTKAALISRAFAELTRFGRAEGAKPQTLNGLSGLGDLVLSCAGDSSRNFALGRRIAEAGSITAIDEQTLPLSEGRNTAPALLRRAQKKGVSMPITEAVVDLLSGHTTLTDVAARLLERPLKEE